jgi:hypothetical protein
MGLSSESTVVVFCTDSRREELLDALLGDPRDFDMIFVESISRAYTCIKELRPDVVVLFTTMSDDQCFPLLSMLAMDRNACGIPVVTYALPRNGDGFEGVVADIERHVSIGLCDATN